MTMYNRFNDLAQSHKAGSMATYSDNEIFQAMFPHASEGALDMLVHLNTVSPMQMVVVENGPAWRKSQFSSYGLTDLQKLINENNLEDIVLFQFPTNWINDIERRPSGTAEKYRSFIRELLPHHEAQMLLALPEVNRMAKVAEQPRVNMYMYINPHDSDFSRAVLPCLDVPLYGEDDAHYDEHNRRKNKITKMFAEAMSLPFNERQVLWADGVDDNMMVSIMKHSFNESTVIETGLTELLSVLKEKHPEKYGNASISVTTSALSLTADERPVVRYNIELSVSEQHDVANQLLFKFNSGDKMHAFLSDLANGTANRIALSVPSWHESQEQFAFEYNIFNHLPNHVLEMSGNVMKNTIERNQQIDFEHDLANLLLNHEPDLTMPNARYIWGLSHALEAQDSRMNFLKLATNISVQSNSAFVNNNIVETYLTDNKNNLYSVPTESGDNIWLSPLQMLHVSVAQHLARHFKDDPNTMAHLENVVLKYRDDQQELNVPINQIILFKDHNPAFGDMLVDVNNPKQATDFNIHRVIWEPSAPSNELNNTMQHAVSFR